MCFLNEMEKKSNLDRINNIDTKCSWQESNLPPGYSCLMVLRATDIFSLLYWFHISGRQGLHCSHALYITPCACSRMSHKWEIKILTMNKFATIVQKSRHQDPVYYCCTTNSGDRECCGNKLSTSSKVMLTYITKLYHLSMLNCNLEISTNFTMYKFLQALWVTY